MKVESVEAPKQLTYVWGDHIESGPWLPIEGRIRPYNNDGTKDDDSTQDYIQPYKFYDMQSSYTPILRNDNQQNNIYKFTPTSTAPLKQS